VKVHRTGTIAKLTDTGHSMGIHGGAGLFLSPAPTKRGAWLVARLRQKMLLVVTVLAMLAATMPGVAVAAAKKESTKSNQDASSSAASALPGSVKGTGTSGPVNFKFKAKSTKGGGSASNHAKGKYSFTAGGEFLQGKVQCLEAGQVATGGAAANFEGKITKTNLSGNKGQEFVFDVFDSGQPNGAGDTIAFSEGSPTCTTPAPGGSTISSGDIVVTAKNPLA
jgi:hypothetical protein